MTLRKNNMFIISFFLFLIGFLILITKELSNNRGIRIDLSENNMYLYISLVFFLLAVYVLYIKFTKKISIQHSKCPTCKESFNYAELKNGKCKYCDEKDTIEIDEYYKKYPEELKDI